MGTPSGTRTPGRTYQFADALGSVIGLANGSGQLTEKYAYAAYGTGVVTESGTVAYRFAGRRLDRDTGLYRNRTRAHSPVVGRLLRADPIGTEESITLYAAVSVPRTPEWPAIAGAGNPSRSRPDPG